MFNFNHRATRLVTVTALTGALLMGGTGAALAATGSGSGGSGAGTSATPTTTTKASTHKRATTKATTHRRATTDTGRADVRKDTRQLRLDRRALARDVAAHKTAQAAKERRLIRAELRDLRADHAKTHHAKTHHATMRHTTTRHTTAR